MQLKSSNKVSAHYLEEFRAFASEFLNETDRAAVILGAAKLDILLYQVLQKYLVPNTSGSDDLLDGDSPLGTFSARITVVYRLGLISKEFARSLHLVRRIRNSFAHELSGISLNSGSHRDRVKELVGPFRVLKGFQDFVDSYFREKPGPSGEFRAVVATLSLRLDGLFDSLIPVGEKGFSLIPPIWLKAQKDDKVESNDAP